MEKNCHRRSFLCGAVRSKNAEGRAWVLSYSGCSIGVAPECQREALRQIDFFFGLNVFGFDSVADDLFRAKSDGQGLSIDLTAHICLTRSHLQEPNPVVREITLGSNIFERGHWRFRSLPIHLVD